MLSVKNSTTSLGNLLFIFKINLDLIQKQGKFLFLEEKMTAVELLLFISWLSLSLLIYLLSILMPNANNFTISLYQRQKSLFLKKSPMTSD